MWNLAFCNVPWPANMMSLLSDSPSTYDCHLDLTLTLLALLKKSFARVNRVFLSTRSRPNSSWSRFSFWLESWRCSLSVKSFDRTISRAWLFSFSTVEFHSCKRTSSLDPVINRMCEPPFPNPKLTWNPWMWDIRRGSLGQRAEPLNRKQEEEPKPKHRFFLHHLHPLQPQLAMEDDATGFHLRRWVNPTSWKSCCV